MAKDTLNISPAAKLARCISVDRSQVATLIDSISSSLGYELATGH